MFTRNIGRVKMEIDIKAKTEYVITYDTEARKFRIDLKEKYKG